MEKYIINENTLAVIALNNGAKVVENYVTYNFKDSAYDIVNNSCNFYGSSVRGRIEATSYLIGSKYKSPIIISEERRIIMFPTSSFHKKDCMWFNINAIKNYYEDNNLLTIMLTNDVKININLSKFVISNQILKSLRLQSLIKGKNR